MGSNTLSQAKEDAPLSPCCLGQDRPWLCHVSRPQGSCVQSTSREPVSESSAKRLQAMQLVSPAF